MNCPVCKNVNLLMSERQGIEIDYCPNCRGVWLDRGELDKLIEKASPAGGAPYEEPYRGQPQHSGHSSDTHYRGGSHYPKYPKKRKGLLGELFDFD